MTSTDTTDARSQGVESVSESTTRQPAPLAKSKETTPYDEILTVGKLLEAVGGQIGLPVPSLHPDLAAVRLGIEALPGYPGPAGAVLTVEDAHGPEDDCEGFASLGLGPLDGSVPVSVPVEFEQVVLAMIDASERAHRWEAALLRESWDELRALRAVVDGLQSRAEVV